LNERRVYWEIEKREVRERKGARVRVEKEGVENKKGRKFPTDKKDHWGWGTASAEKTSLREV